jgi:hypothetical protein
MSGFDFAFTLFGLLLGLSLTELFGGFARALRRRRSIRIGWLSPLLALVMTVDLVSHWVAAWSDREAIAVTFPMLLFGTAIAGLYYMAAALVVPDEIEEWHDLDSYFFTQKRWVVLAILLSNSLFVAGEIIVHGNFFTNILPVLKVGLWLGSGVALVLARPRWLNVLLLLWYLQLYWIVPLL